jgi:hypothetical protein
VTDGAARYAKARRQALTRTGDPQGAGGGEDWADPGGRSPETYGPAGAPARVARLMARCATVTGGTADAPELCGVPAAEHHLTDPSAAWPAGRRTYCTRQDGPRRHPCHLYTPPA